MELSFLLANTTFPPEATSSAGKFSFPPSSQEELVTSKANEPQPETESHLDEQEPKLLAPE